VPGALDSTGSPLIVGDMVGKKFWVAGQKTYPAAPVLPWQWFNTLETGYTNINTESLILITQ